MKDLLSLFRTSHHIVQLSLADVDDSLARTRSRGADGPSITWLVGHILQSRYQVLSFLGNERPNPWTESFGEVPATDGANYPTLAELRREWISTHQLLEAAFAGAAENALDQPVNDQGLHGESRIGDKVAFLAWHEGYHVGVIGAIRVAAGLDGPAVLARAAAQAGAS